MSRGFTALVVSVLVTAPAQAAPCCLSATAFGVGRLSAWEDAALLAGVSAAPSLGRWDSRGRFIGNADGSSDLELGASVAAVVGLSDRVQLSGRLPWLLNRSTADGVEEFGGGIADATVGMRLELLGIGERDWVPGLAIDFGTSVPFGRSMADAQNAFATDVTGRGAWLLGLGVTAEQVEGPWYLQARVGGTVPLPGVAGPSLELSLSGGRQLFGDGVLSLMARASLEAPRTIGGRAVAGSAARELALSPSFSWKLAPHWTVQASVEAVLLGANRAERVVAGGTLRYGFF